MEIKFRGKRLDNGEWEYGYLVKYGFAGKEKYYIVPSHASALYSFEVDPATVGQYTGLKVKNGMEIYEGDIILADWRSTPCKWKVYRDNETQYWDIESHHGILEGLYDYHKYCIVIGNVHEHPELLEEPPC